MLWKNVLLFFGYTVPPLSSLQYIISVVSGCHNPHAQSSSLFGGCRELQNRAHAQAEERRIGHAVPLLRPGLCTHRGMHVWKEDIL